MKYRFGKDDSFMIFLNLLVIGYGIYYNHKLIWNDFTGIYWIFLIVLCLVMVVSDFFSIIYSSQLSHLIFIGAIAFIFHKAYQMNEFDRKKMDTLYLEIVNSGTPFSENLDEELATKGPIYGAQKSWVYHRINSNEFSLYWLDKFNLMRRDFPDTRGWYAVVQNDIVLKVLQMRELTEPEKEREIERILAEMNLADFPTY